MIALDIAGHGIHVHLIEREPSIGGHMIQYAEVFPTLDCPQCIMTPKMVEVSQHPNIQLMTYLTAIANAGGYTYRAKQDVVYVIRGDDPTQTEIKLSVEEKVLPGDIIRVAERLF